LKVEQKAAQVHALIKWKEKEGQKGGKNHLKGAEALGTWSGQGGKNRSKERWEGSFKDTNQSRGMTPNFQRPPVTASANGPGWGQKSEKGWSLSCETELGRKERTPGGLVREKGTIICE